MKYVKLTVLTRSIDAIYEYNKSGRSFWDDLAAFLRDTDAAVDKQGRFRCLYYFPSQEEDVVARATEWIKKLGQDPDAFVISATDMNAFDVEQLKKKNVDRICEKPWFREAEKQILETTPAEKKEPKRPETTDGKNEAKDDTKNDTKNVLKKDSEKPAPEKEATEETPAPAPTNDLATEAARISDLKTALLSIVHGQRHAVDEVARTIFECDAFNRMNEKRRGPLATFLFTGPSGVGKTFLATQCARLLGKKYLVVDMSEFSDNLSNGKFNGEHGQPAIVTGFIRENPDGIIIFDEIEKAHLNTIHLFLQILDAGRLRDMKLNKEVSFRDTIVFITTNAGSSLYDDPTVVDLSSVTRRVILEALRTDIKPGTTDEPYFPACLTTRFANGHVILFNHLEPFALMQIVRDEIAAQIELFRKAYDVEISYDPAALSALVLYSSGGLADARTLRGMAKNMIVKELQEVVLQTFRTHGDGVNALKRIDVTVEPEHNAPEVKRLFSGHDTVRVPVFADAYVVDKIKPLLQAERTEYEFFSDPDEAKRRVRGVVDYILIDPAAGSRPMSRTPNDLEDIDADGIDLFHYLKEYYPEIPVYFLDVRGRGETAFSSLLAKGGRGVIELDPESPEEAKERISALSFGALVNNSTFSLGRSGKILLFDCSQYSVDETRVIIAFDKLSLDYAPSSKDSDVITRTNDKNGVTFNDVIGCKEAKSALRDFCRFVSDPRQIIMQGKKIPRGVLLYGPPGTGKTMLAKAMANEANAAFIPTTATALFGPYVGESEKNVRELFRRARRYAPAVIFIDEVDAIARTRTGSIGTTHNEDTLNAFIAEMDGFSTDDKRPVFVLAATNYDVSGDGPRVLDPAFVRRFDRKIFVDLPDTDERYELLKMILSRHGVDLGPDHEKILRNMADRSSGMSNADLTTVVDMFLRACEDKEPSGAELMDALDAFRFGEVNDLDPNSLRQTACHESGHALVAGLLGETPSFLTVVSRGSFGGYMEHDHDEKKSFFTFRELMNRVCIALAGRAAELKVYGADAGLNTGASGDLSHARYLVKTAFNDYAMGEKLFTDSTDDDCEKLMREQFEHTVELLSENVDVLNELTDLLVEKKSLNRAELERFFADHLKKDRKDPK